MNSTVSNRNSIIQTSRNRLADSLCGSSAGDNASSTPHSSLNAGMKMIETNTGVYMPLREFRIIDGYSCPGIRSNNGTSSFVGNGRSQDPRNHKIPKYKVWLKILSYISLARIFRIQPAHDWTSCRPDFETKKRPTSTTSAAD